MKTLNKLLKDFDIAIVGNAKSITYEDFKVIRAMGNAIELATEKKVVITNFIVVGNNPKTEEK